MSTKPRPLSEAEKTLYSKEQMAKEKVLSQIHEDFSPVLQVLYHVLHLQSDGFDPSNCSDDEYIGHMGWGTSGAGSGRMTGVGPPARGRFRLARLLIVGARVVFVERLVQLLSR